MRYKCEQCNKDTPILYYSKKLLKWVCKMCEWSSF